VAWTPASADYRVLTPERVSLRYDLAGIGSRGAAVMVDTLLQMALTGLLFAGTLALLFVLGVLQELANAVLTLATPEMGTFVGFLVFALLIIAVFAIWAGYFIVFEIIWNGQTPGKRLLGLRVMRENGYPIRPADAVIRNLVRIVDGLPTAYALGLIVMLLNSRARRLGDFAAGTIVVREGPTQAAPLAITESQGTARLSASDATLVRDFLLRRSSLDTPARAALAQRLADSLSRRYGLQCEDDPEAFLEQLGV
jgi:uncharacterized RDD family membrane protein YckC